MGQQTKKQYIMEICKQYNLDEIGKYEIELINDKLGMILGRGGRTSISYIIDVLKDGGKVVTYSSMMEHTDAEYKSVFKDVLKYKTTEQALECIRNIHEKYNYFKSVNDIQGMEYAEWIALKGWQMAQVISRNHRVNEEKRVDKKEISKLFIGWYNDHDGFFERHL